jgi:hypothetical protein
MIIAAGNLAACKKKIHTILKRALRLKESRHASEG